MTHYDQSEGVADWVGRRQHTNVGPVNMAGKCEWRGWVYHGDGWWHHRRWGWWQDDGSWGSDYYCSDSNFNTMITTTTRTSYKTVKSTASRDKTVTMTTTVPAAPITTTTILSVTPSPSVTETVSSKATVGSYATTPLVVFDWPVLAPWITGKTLHTVHVTIFYHGGIL